MLRIHSGISSRGIIDPLNPASTSTSSVPYTATCVSVRASPATNIASPTAASEVLSTTGTISHGSAPKLMPKSSLPKSSSTNPCSAETAKQGSSLPRRICPRVIGAARSRTIVPWRRSATKSQPTVSTRKNANVTV